MTAKELAEKLLALPPEHQALPVCFLNDVWLEKVEGVEHRTYNEFGVGKDYPHIRLSWDSLAAYQRRCRDEQQARNSQ